jgi:tRNA-specific 2-thiouridylase
MKERVIAAMSGGVDSSVAAALLKKQGYEVVGVTMQLLPQADAGGVNPVRNYSRFSKATIPAQSDSKHLTESTQRAAFSNGVKTCCGLSGIEDARRVAAELGIPHYVLNFREVFARDVIDDFLEEYKRGRTPNPCIRCNKFIKFGALFQKADALKARHIATGHYARIEHDRRYRLKRGGDYDRDQSYFLYSVDQDQLERILFPLGDLTKIEVRTIAQELGLRVAKKPASQEICFVTDDDYRRFLNCLAPETAKPGPIYDTGGNYLGEHKGIAFYTVGQRRGLRIALGRRMYVVGINPLENTVILGEEKEGYGSELIADSVNLISIDRLDGAVKVKAKIRHGMPAAEAIVVPIDDNRIRLKFSKPQWAITPGQAVVMYDGDLVVGGGTIVEKVK